MWYQLNIECADQASIEGITEALEELAALSVTLTDKNDNPVLEPAPGTTPLWPEVVIQALFAQREEAEECWQQLVAIYPFLSSHIESIPDQDWQNVWMDEFKPLSFGQRLWICPSWHSPPDPDAVNLFLDPGLAFGTGTHPTTSLCLSWLEQADLNDARLIDYGCGSGILALAAIKLGATEVQAVDIDEQALQATKNNARANHIADKKLSVSAPEHLQISSDILMANILLAPLIDLKERFYQLINKQGLLVVSGLLQEQTDSLIASYQSHFSHQHSSFLDGWALLIFKRI